MVAARKGKAMARRAYSYIRWSFSGQAKGDSKRRQLLDWAPEVCEREGWLLDESTTMTDGGVSAFRSKNVEVGALAAFLADVCNGIVPRGSVLLVESLDRLSRDDVDEAFDLFRKLIRAGISIRTREPDRYYDADAKLDLLQMLEVLFIFARANEESATKSFRLREKWKARREKAKSTGAPCGKRIPGWLHVVNGQYQFKPKAKELIRHVHELAQAGLGLRQLLHRLQVTEKRPLSPTGGKWTVSTLRRILTSRALLGEYEPKARAEDGSFRPTGEVLDGYYPAAISHSIWLRTQRATRARAGKSGRPARRRANLFSGICYHAGTKTRVSLVTEPRSYGPGHYDYLRVSQEAHVTHRDCPFSLRFPLPLLEGAILDAIDELSAADILPPSKDVDAREGRIGQLGADLDALAERAEMLRDRAADKALKPADVADALQLLARVRAEQAELADERQRLMMESEAGQSTNLCRLQSLLGTWRAADQVTADERTALAARIRNVLQRVVSEVWVLPQRLARHKTVLHVQIYLHGVTKPRYVQALPGALPNGVRLWQLDGVDLRESKIADLAALATGA